MLIFTLNFLKIQCKTTLGIDTNTFKSRVQIKHAMPRLKLALGAF